VHCHGDIVDNMDDGHTIPTYEPSLVTPAPSRGEGLPLNSRGKGAGACDYCHDDGISDEGVDVGTNMNNHHNTGFLAQGKCSWCHDFTGCEDCSGGACGFCHSMPQGAEEERDQITGEGGQFEKLSHHVGPDVIAEDCMVCHDLTYHLDGDSGTIPDPQVYLKDPDGGPSITYDGTPESLETFCINCHDGDGADGNLIPFSDGMTVPNVKGVAGSMWDDSAHAQIGFAANENNPITCFGDGMTTGCHTSVHGSDYEKLLPESPIDQFCYNCHTEGLLENNSISLWDIPYCWGTDCDDKGSHTGLDNQAVLTGSRQSRGKLDQKQQGRQYRGNSSKYDKYDYREP
jgi:predicted CXXCH cytochrome family protein